MRPIAVLAALAGMRQVDTATKAFMSWFGPLVVFCSIIAHGVTDAPGSEWMARRAERSEEARAGCSAVPAEVERPPAV